MFEDSSEQNEIILKEKFRLAEGGSPRMVYLTKSGLTISGTDEDVTVNSDCSSDQQDWANNELIIPFDRLLNCTPCLCPLSTKPNSEGLAFLVRTPPSSKCKSCNLTYSQFISSNHSKSVDETPSLRIFYCRRMSCNQWKLWTLRLIPLNPLSLEIINLWSFTIADIIGSLGSRPKKLLVFINPYGGKKKAKSLFNKKVDPIFIISGIRSTVVTTQYSGHARDYILESKDLYAYDGVVCVGGDGMANEIINGVVQRAQRDSGISFEEEFCKLEPASMPVAVIPAGSTDSLVCSTTGVHCPVNSTLHIAMGNRMKIDVGSIYSGGRLVRFFSGFLSYGFFGDNIEFSEKYRWMGPMRYSWTGWQTFMKNQAYPGELRINVVKNSSKQCTENESLVCTKGCSHCADAKAKLAAEREIESIKICGKFVSLNCALIPNRCSLSKAGFSPFSHLSDGVMQLSCVQGGSRLNLLKFLTAISNSANRDPCGYEFVDSFPSVSFEFIPSIDKQASKKGVSVWHCDGELLHNYTNIHVRSHCQLLEIFACGIETQPNLSASPLLSSSLKMKQGDTLETRRKVVNEIAACCEF